MYKITNKIRLLLVCGLVFPTLAEAATITNAITGVGPSDHPVAPYVCIQNANGQVTYALAPAESVDGNTYSGNSSYVGATLRFGGCSENDSYLGYLGLSLNNNHNNAIQSYSPPKGVHVIFAHPTIDSKGILIGAITYTPIKPNFNLLTKEPSQNSNWDFVGVNLSGLEFSKMIDPVVIPNLSAEDISENDSDLVATQAFLQAGMNTIRVPVRWGYLQLAGPGKGEIYTDYYNSYVKPLLETLTSAHVYTIVDLHSYMHYSIFAKQVAGCSSDGPCPDGTLVIDPTAYESVWTKLYALMKNDPQINMNYIMLDLVNEPVGVPNDDVFTIQAQVIKNLRNHGYQGYILVEGNNWSGLHSWTTSSWTSNDGKITYTNASLFTRDNFMKAGITDLSKIIINVHQYFDNNYSGTHDTCLTDLTTVGDNGFNLNAFAAYLKQNNLQAMVTEFGGGTDSASCSSAINSFMQYLQSNSAKNKQAGFLGWTIWSTGHGWGNYNLRVTPASYQMQVLENYLQPM